MDNCGTGAEKVCRFVSTRSFYKLRMTTFLFAPEIKAYSERTY